MAEDGPNMAATARVLSQLVASPVEGGRYIQSSAGGRCLCRKTQANVALSSGEVELNSAVKVIMSEGLGVRNTLCELSCEDRDATHCVGTSACNGVLLHTGAGA